MAKVILTDITSSFASVAAINARLQTIEDAFDNTLSRDGASPNYMVAQLDMNSNRVINLGYPLNNNDAATKKYVDDSNQVAPLLETMLDAHEAAVDPHPIYITESELTVTLSSSLTPYQLLSSRGIANGYASLGPDGKIPGAQLPVSGSYLGTWNASTNSPTITSGVGTQGDFYLVGTAGSTTINGVSSWSVGDQIRFSGTVWQRIANSNLVNSVAGKTGAVSLVPADVVGLGTAAVVNTGTSGGVVPLLNGFNTFSGANDFNIPFGLSTTVRGALGDSGRLRLFNNNHLSSGVLVGQGFLTGSDNVGFLFNTANADVVLGTNNLGRFRVTADGGFISEGVVGGTKGAGTINVAEGFIRNNRIVTIDDLSTSVFATIAVLRSYAVTGDGRRPEVSLLANWALGDGGGIFYLDAADTTSLDDGGIVIVDAAGSRWKRKRSGPINVKWFGATGDGSTNDGPAFARMVAYVNANPLDSDPNYPASTVVYIPMGDYQIDQKLTFTRLVSIVGDSRVSTKLNWTAAVSGIEMTYAAVDEFITVRDFQMSAGALACGTALTINFHPTPSTPFPRLFMENVLIDGLIFGNYWTNGIRLVNPWNIVLSSVHVIGGNYVTDTNWMTRGIEIAGTLSISGIYFRDCQVQNAKTSYDFTANHSEGVTFDNCFAITTNIGWKFQGEPPGSAALDIAWWNCHASVRQSGSGLPSNAITFVRGRSVQITDCEFYLDGAGAATDTLIYLEDHGDLRILNTRFLKVHNVAGTNAIYMFGVADFVVENCSFSFFNESGDAPITATGSVSRGAVFGCTYYQCQPNQIASSNVAITHLGNAINLVGYNEGGSLSMPKQPSSVASLSAPVTNQTGDGTVYDPVMSLELRDQGNNFASGVFTAPVAGVYDVCWKPYLTGLTAAHTDGTVVLLATGREYVTTLNFGAMRSASNQLSLSVAEKVFLNEGDTIRPRLIVSGGSKTVGLNGDATNVYTSFSVSLLH